MKNLIYLFIFISVHSYSQEIFLKTYKIKLSTNNLDLMKDESILFNKFSLKQKKELSNYLILGDSLTFTEMKIINGNKVPVKIKKRIDSAFIHKQTRVISKKVTGFCEKKAHIKFDESSNKLFINPINTDKIYYYQLKSGNEFKLSFSEFTISALTIPIKYRIKQIGVDEDFSSGINLNFFIGRSNGKTNFMHRKGVKNKINIWKISYGFLVGTSTIEIDSNNTITANEPLSTNESYNKGLLSLGIGASYSFNSINFGVFYGYDYAIGKSANKWDYNKKPWIGIAIGYSILKF